MEQKSIQKSKRKLWTVGVVIREPEGLRKKYVYLEVTRYYHEAGLLYVWQGKKEHHVQDMKRIERVEVREHMYDRIR